MKNSAFDHARFSLDHARFSSPEEFVGWFLNAEYVLTNSFHGTAFSVIFHKNLVVELKTKLSTNTRSRAVTGGTKDVILHLGESNTMLFHILAI